MTEQPQGDYAAAPSGTPYAQRSQVADVWCTHGVQWVHEQAGYLPTVNDALHPDIPCLDAGAIPEECQPIVAHDPAKYPNAGPQAVEAIRDEVRQELGY